MLGERPKHLKLSPHKSASRSTQRIANGSTRVEQVRDTEGRAKLMDTALDCLPDDLWRPYYEQPSVTQQTR